MYQVHKFMLTNNQLKKVKKALDDDKKCILNIPDNHFTGDHPLPLTDSELKHVHDGDGYATISLSKKKLQHIRDNKEGGFLTLLGVCECPSCGCGLALKYKHRGKGLYLKPYSSSRNGFGLISLIGNSVRKAQGDSTPMPSMPPELSQIPIIGSLLNMIYGSDVLFK